MNSYGNDDQRTFNCVLRKIFKTEQHRNDEDGTMLLSHSYKNSGFLSNDETVGVAVLPQSMVV